MQKARLVGDLPGEDIHHVYKFDRRKLSRITSRALPAALTLFWTFFGAERDDPRRAEIMDELTRPSMVAPNSMKKSEGMTFS